MSFSIYLIIGMAPITTSIYYYIVKSNNNSKIDNDWEFVDISKPDKKFNNSFIELENHITTTNVKLMKENIIHKNINY